MAIFFNSDLPEYTPTFMERKIEIIIKNSKSEDYSEIIKNNVEWDIFYHFSKMRESLINWYDFAKDSSVLEINPEFGALTGYLCDKCKEVVAIAQSNYQGKVLFDRYNKRENLSIFCGSLDQLKSKYNYILVVGAIEIIGNGVADFNIYIEYIEKLTEYLKKDGRILFAVENKFGIKYFCGAIESYSGRLFEGINGYPHDSRGYSFSRKEILDIIERAGLKYQKVYYPLPDYKLPQIIYTDEYIEGSAVSERLNTYDFQKETYIINEKNIYQHLIDNKSLPFLSNSFFIESSKDIKGDHTIFATVSTDRNKSESFITTISDKKIVKKCPIYNDGREKLLYARDNILALKKRGINVISCEFENGALRMPYINNITLSNYLYNLSKYDKEIFINLFDKLFECILNSSDHAEAKDNLLISNYQNIDFGVILNKCYIDMIPINCFLIDSDLYFFDQEFTKDFYPANFVIFRALKYTYMFSKHAEELIPIKCMISKYKLEKIWDIYEKEELSFVAKNRNFELYKSFYEWTNFDIHKIYNKSDILFSKTCDLREYTLTEITKKIKIVQLDLLGRLQEVCEKNKLTYFAIYGTLLGAVRHSGIIPWDDDIDIIMPRNDYNKLLKISDKEFAHPYFLQTMYNDDCFYGGFCKLRNSDTTSIEPRNWKKNCNQGIGLDVFPLDNCYTDSKKNKLLLKKICFIQRLLLAKCYGHMARFEDIKLFRWKFYKYLGLFISKQKMITKLEILFSSCTEDNTTDITIFGRYTAGKGTDVFKKVDFLETIYMDFEDRKIPVPSGYANCLKKIYGNDYMKYPPVYQRVTHHQGFFAPNVPFDAYLSRFRNIFCYNEDKVIILFGTDEVSTHYFKRYGNKHKPYLVVDDDSHKWNDKINNIAIQNPEVILQFSPEKIHLIIASSRFRYIEMKIRKMGILDYYIYVPNYIWLINASNN